MVRFCRDNNVPILYGSPKRGRDEVVRKHSTYLDWHHESSHKFTVIRNPFTRLVSWFRYLSGLGVYSCDFSTFVRQKLEPEAGSIKTPSPWRLQATWIDDAPRHKIKMFAFENINQALPLFLGRPGPLPLVNVTNTDHRDLGQWYDDDLKRHIESHFARDFGLWEEVMDNAG